MAMIWPYLLVGVGGFFGAIARFAVGHGVVTLVHTRFPLATFVINISGSFFLGLLGAAIADRFMPTSEALRLALGVGFLGAYTTFSAFELETHGLIEEGLGVMAVLYVAASTVLGLFAVRAGIGVGKLWLS